MRMLSPTIVYVNNFSYNPETVPFSYLEIIIYNISLGILIRVTTIEQITVYS